MLPEDLTLRAENLSKSYRIAATPAARLTSPVLARLAQIPGLPARWKAGLQRRAEAGMREFFALRDISFSLPRGQSVGIIGRNGSGKSTLLQVLTGTLAPTSGSGEVRGRVAALLELGSGFNPEFTGRENVRLNAALLGLTPAQIEARMGDILTFADIGDFVEQPVKTYSSGMMLRLAFAVIVHIDADVLIIDEALAVGDVFFVQKCVAFLRRFQETGVLLLVTHDPTTITTLCQRALWLDAGRLRMDGDPKSVTEAYLDAFFKAEAEAKLDPVTRAQLAEAGAATAGSAGLASRNDRASAPGAAAPGKVKPRRDARLDWLNRTPLRNDIKVFPFDPEAPSAGVGGGIVLDASLEDAEGQPLAWIVGGEPVVLRVTLESRIKLSGPILGFFVKNQLGQMLFGDNTYLSTHGSPEGRPVRVGAGERLEARFRFTMPLLPASDYTITLGFADGTQDDHLMHHWVHDALSFKSVTTSVAGGLVGIAMDEISLVRLPGVGSGRSGATVVQPPAPMAVA